MADVTFVRATGGGLEDFAVVAAAGTTETLDLADGNVFDVTLDDDCTFTFTGTTAGVACGFTVIVRQDGSGGHTASWPGNVSWAAGTVPTATATPGAVDVYTFLTVDDGTSWFGFTAGQDFS